METAQYSVKSPYGKTPVDGRFLGTYVHRPIPSAADDSMLTVTTRYVWRPDLLALDVYGDQDLWWVIPQRNGLEDPVFDMVPGLVLVVPSQITLKSVVR